MSDSFEARAAARRVTWRSGVARSFEEMEEHDPELWLRASPAERIRAVHLLDAELPEAVRARGE